MLNFRPGSSLTSDCTFHCVYLTAGLFYSRISWIWMDKAARSTQVWPASCTFWNGWLIIGLYCHVDMCVDVLCVLYFRAAQLVKPIKGSVMPVKKKRKLPDADDHERKCKITRWTHTLIDSHWNCECLCSAWREATDWTLKNDWLGGLSPVCLSVCLLDRHVSFQFIHQVCPRGYKWGGQNIKNASWSKSSSSALLTTSSERWINSFSSTWTSEPPWRSLQGVTRRHELNVVMWLYRPQ